MKLATYIDQLTGSGVQHKLAVAHAMALESMLHDKLVTKDYLDAKLAATTAELTFKLHQALFIQTACIGLVLAILKLTSR